MKTVCCLGLLLCVVQLTSCGDDSAAAVGGTVELGAMAPDFEVTELSTGKQVKLSDFKGKVVVAEFWWSKCGLCNDKMDHLQPFISEHGDWGDGVVYLGVSIDPTMQSAKRHVSAVEAEENRGWSKTKNCWLDSDHGESPIYAAYVAETGIPVCYVIDREGKVAAIELSTNPDGLDFEQTIGGLLK